MRSFGSAFTAATRSVGALLRRGFNPAGKSGEGVALALGAAVSLISYAMLIPDADSDGGTIPRLSKAAT
ncbi:hypothetical protein [Nocardia fluminea]|uniref:hypothetical protein n=1 Tax=Nocardia fluminea TaxID=134984 RepID=UPI0034075417